MTILHQDFETYSYCDLLSQGLYNYAQHPSTGIHCLGWAFDEDDPQLWVPGTPFPMEVLAFWAHDAPRSNHAHNAAFERMIHKHVLVRTLYEDGQGCPELSLDAWYCTQAQARARNLPAALEDLGRALELPFRKDRRGKDLIRLLCVPRLGRAVNFEVGQLLIEEDPEEAAKHLPLMYEYCLQDVVVERAAEHCSGPLTDTEFDDYIISEIINGRGLHVDLEFARAASQYAAEESEEIADELSELTGGEVTGTKQYKRFKDWLAPYAEAQDELRRAMTVYKTDRQTKETTKKISFDRNVRQTILAMAEDGMDIPEEVLEFCELVDEASRSSVYKYKSMADRASPDGRVRGAYLYAGAGQTKRFSSKGLQTHNFVRASHDNFDDIRASVIAHEELEEGRVMDTLAIAMRQTITAQQQLPDDHPLLEPPAGNKELVWGDWSAIEARVLPWLSRHPKAEPLLNRFRKGEDIYIPEAANIYGVPESEIDGEMRQIGKVSQLSLGFQGAVKALQSMARNYGIHIDDVFAARVVGKWRKNNPWAVKFWAQLERQAIKAVRNPGQLFKAGRVAYVFDEDWQQLYCKLPNGEYLSYPRARVELDGDRFRLSAMKANWKPAADDPDAEWPRVDLYGGMLAENITQATAGCILRDTLRALEDFGWPVVGHTHDEVVLEVYEDEREEAEETLAFFMPRASASWAVDLPLAAEIKHGRRYRK